MTINTNIYRLVRNGVVLRVEPQVFNIIVYLIENRSKVVTRQELLDTIWKGKIVSDSSISNHIKSARKVLGDDGQKQIIIKTIHGRGYQFITELDDSDIPLPRTINKLTFLIIALALVVGIMWFSSLTNKVNPVIKDIAVQQQIDKSIAVLAFKDLSPKADQAYFSEGISEELLNLFTKIPDLRVASRTSSFSFKNKPTTIENIGKELNVAYVMEGSVRKSGEQLRVTAQLIRVLDGSHIWSETYDYQMQDIFKIQDEIAQAVSEQLELSMSKGMTKKEPINPEAQSLYLKALYYFKENNENSLNQALIIITESIAEDNNYAPAWTLRSRIYYKLAIYSYEKDDNEYIQQAKKAAIKAKSIDKKSATTNAQMALINLIDFDFKSARFNIDLAMSSNNIDPEAIDIIAYYYLISGQVEKSVDLLFDEMDNNPIIENLSLPLSGAYLFFNQLKDFKNRSKKYMFFYPAGQGIYELYYYYLVVNKEVERALNEAELNNNQFWKLNIAEFVNFAQGNNHEADKFLQELIVDYSFSPMHIAIHYAVRKDSKNAFKWLETAWQNQDIELLYLINHHAFRNIWNNPQWKKFISKLNLPKEHWLLDVKLIKETSEPTNES